MLGAAARTRRRQGSPASQASSRRVSPSLRPQLAARLGQPTGSPTPAVTASPSPSRGVSAGLARCARAPPRPPQGAVSPSTGPHPGARQSPTPSQLASLGVRHLLRKLAVSRPEPNPGVSGRRPRGRARWTPVGPSGRSVRGCCIRSSRAGRAEPLPARTGAPPPRWVAPRSLPTCDDHMPGGLGGDLGLRPLLPRPPSGGTHGCVHWEGHQWEGAVGPRGFRGEAVGRRADPGATGRVPSGGVPGGVPGGPGGGPGGPPAPGGNFPGIFPGGPGGPPGAPGGSRGVLGGPWGGPWGVPWGVWGGTRGVGGPTPQIPPKWAPRPLPKERIGPEMGGMGGMGGTPGIPPYRGGVGPIRALP